MAKLNTLTWNINQRTRQGKIIPDIVTNEILNRQKDIVVLTEFYKTSNMPQFTSELEQNGYQLFIDPRPKTDCNEILIAIKNSIIKNIIKIAYIDNTFDNPDLLQVSIVTTDDKILNIIGTRIKIDVNNYLKDIDFKRRKRQFDEIIKLANTLDGNTIITGDFNNAFHKDGENSNSYIGKGREFYNYYMIKEIFKNNNFTLYTPLNATSCGNNKIDHIAIKNGMVINNQELIYDWNFQQISKIGYPDHAILLAEFEF